MFNCILFNCINNYLAMIKEKMYDPEKVGSFKMMFGFEQPGVYRTRKVKSNKKENKKRKS